MSTKKQTVVSYNNNFGVANGNIAFQRFCNKCENNIELRSRDYHQGLKSILGNNDKDTIFTNGIMTKAEGLSPRLLLMR